MFVNCEFVAIPLLKVETTKKNNFVDIFNSISNYFFIKQLAKIFLLFRMRRSISEEVVYIESKFGKLRDQSTILIKKNST